MPASEPSFTSPVNQLKSCMLFQCPPYWGSLGLLHLVPVGNNGTEHLMTFQAQVVIRPRAAVTQLDPVMGNQALIIAAVKNETAAVKIFFFMNMQSMQNMF
jgi:hypothetical protein